jgi:hypothetical protein
MRWDDLFDDLEAQLSELADAELADEISQRRRTEVSKFRLVDRLRPAFGHRVAITALGQVRTSGLVANVGPDWLLLHEDRGAEALIRLGAVTTVSGLGTLSAQPGSEGKVAARLTLGHALRGIARDRSAVAIRLCDGGPLAGTVDRVGADFFEVAEHAPDEARRPGQVAGVRTVPFDGLALLRRQV